ncbi:Hsp20/alpha crystallin family protein [Fusibacter sp. JL216-2]|uniref:Hsp20/alpha crystallin family protein n=1 Tax=Fusibacter sp. JL216-2 TaxID=3071453 RepID=UPI003D344AE0
MSGLVPFNRKRNDLMNAGFGDFQNMLDDFFSDAWPMRRSLASDTFKIDVQDMDDHYLVEAEMPGMNKEDIKISAHEGKLNISVEKKEENTENNGNYIHRERRFSSMSRNVFLGDMDDQGIRAKLDDGVLKIEIQKKIKQETSNYIEIE